MHRTVAFLATYASLFGVFFVGGVQGDVLTMVVASLGLVAWAVMVMTSYRRQLEVA